MQIHDLNTKALTDPAYVAFDDGTDTYKADFKAEIDNAAADAVADADLTDNTVAFTSGDAASPTAWTAVSVLTSGLTIKVLFNRISTMIKNVRWLYSKLGTVDISSIGGGTVTGAISSLNSKSTYTCVNTSNNYVPQESTNRISILRRGNVGILRLNLNIVTALPSGNTNIEIGSFPGLPELTTSILANIKSESNKDSAIGVRLLTDGKIDISNLMSGVNAVGWYRAVIPILFG